MMYYFEIKTDDVYNYMMFEPVRTLASYRDTASGFVKKENVKKLFADVKALGKPYHSLKLVTTKRFWANYDQYH